MQQQLGKNIPVTNNKLSERLGKKRTLTYTDKHTLMDEKRGIGKKVTSFVFHNFSRRAICVFEMSFERHACLIYIFKELNFLKFYEFENVLRFASIKYFELC